MNQTTDAVLAGLVLVAMGALAASDARRAVVEPRLVLALVAAAAAWRFGGSGDGEGAWPRLAESVLGAALGIAAVIVPIGAAAWLRRRWPLYPGDAMMLGALGFLLGPLGLAWTMVLGAGFALAYRLCLQRRRGRPFRKGLVPLGPGMCAGAAVVFVCVNCGIALAGDAPGPENAVEAALLAPPTAVGPDEAPTDPVPLSATELGPDLPGLPAGLAARQVRVEYGEALPFPALVRRLSTLTGVAIRIEERPARIVGGAVVLAEPPPLALAWEGTLAGLLDRVAILTGYDWSWETLVPETLVPGTLGPESLVPADGVVFHRYWDVEQRGPAPGDAGVDGSDLEGGPAAEGGAWPVDPARHRTLRGVLENWAGRAGWTLVWNAGRDYALGAPASFGGGFLAAADLLLSGPATRRTLHVRAYEANRHLVVDDADGAGW